MSTEPLQHQPNHRDVDHLFAGLGRVLVVTHEPPMLDQPAGGPLGDESVSVERESLFAQEPVL